MVILTFAGLLSIAVNDFFESLETDALEASLLIYASTVLGTHTGVFTFVNI